MPLRSEKAVVNSEGQLEPLSRLMGSLGKSAELGAASVSRGAAVPRFAGMEKCEIPNFDKSHVLLF